MRCSVSEKIGIHYIGALIATRYFLTPNKHCFFANIGAGLSIYKNHFIINSQEFNLKDNTAAFVAEFGYDFFVTKNFAIGLQASLFFGSQKFFSFVNDKGIVSLGENVQQPNRLNMNHLDISIGFRFYK